MTSEYAPRIRPLTASLLLVLLCVISWTRKGPDFTAPQFWAEDAVVFYAEAERTGAHSLVVPYAGYYNVAPRALALAGRALVPIAWLPAFYLAAALALTWFVLCLVYAARSHAPPFERWLAALTPLLVPFSSEILGVLTNVQWVLALTLVAAYGVVPPRGLAGRATWAAALALALLSGPFSLILLPAALLALVWRRDAWALAVACGHVAAACVTIRPLLAARGPSADTVATTGLNLTHGVIGVLAGRPRLALFCVGFTGLLLFALIEGLRRRSLVIAAPASCGLLVLSATLLGGPPELLLAFPFGGERYVYLPWVCLTWSLLPLLPARRLLVIPALCAMLAVSARFYWFQPLPRFDWRDTAACLEREAFCDTTISPGWRVGLPGRGPARSTPP